MLKKKLVSVFILFFTAVLLFSEGLTSFKVNGRFGYVDKNLNVVIPPQYERAEPFAKNGFACIASLEKGWELIDSKGCKIFTPENRGVIYEVFNDWYSIEKKRLVNVITNQYGGNFFYLADTTTDVDLIPVLVEFDEDYGVEYVTTKGTVAFTFKDYRFAYGFNNGRAVLTSRDSIFMVINEKGSFITDLVLTAAHIRFSEGLLAVEVQESLEYKTGYMDRNGSMAFYVPIVSEITAPSGIGKVNATSFNGGFAAIMTSKKHNVWRIINKKGEYVSEEIKVVTMYEFHDGYSMTSIYDTKEHDFRYGFMGTDGKYLISPIFEDATQFVNGFAQIVYKGRDGLLDTKGQVFWSKDIAAGKPVAIDVMDLR